MAQTTNNGRKVRIYNFTLSTSDTPIVLNDKYISTVIIRCRSAIDLYLRSSAGATNYYTIASGTSLTLNISPNDLTPFSLASASSTPVAEIIALVE